jgi:hypothetical protein
MDDPEALITIRVPLDGEPEVLDTGGLTDYLLQAILVRCAEQYQTVWEDADLDPG